MVHIQTLGYIPSLLFYLGRYFFSDLGKSPFTYICALYSLGDIPVCCLKYFPKKDGLGKFM